MILASLAGAPAIASGTGDGFVAGNQTLALADLPSQPSQDALTRLRLCTPRRLGRPPSNPRLQKGSPSPLSTACNLRRSWKLLL